MLLSVNRSLFYFYFFKNNRNVVQKLYNLVGIRHVLLDPSDARGARGNSIRSYKWCLVYPQTGLDPSAIRYALRERMWNRSSKITIEKFLIIQEKVVGEEDSGLEHVYLVLSKRYSTNDTKSFKILDETGSYVEPIVDLWTASSIHRIVENIYHSNKRLNWDTAIFSEDVRGTVEGLMGVRPFKQLPLVRINFKNVHIVFENCRLFPASALEQIQTKFTRAGYVVEGHLLFVEKGVGAINPSLVFYFQVDKTVTVSKTFFNLSGPLDKTYTGVVRCWRSPIKLKMQNVLLKRFIGFKRDPRSKELLPESRSGCFSADIVIMTNNLHLFYKGCTLTPEFVFSVVKAKAEASGALVVGYLVYVTEYPMWGKPRIDLYVQLSKKLYHPINFFDISTAGVQQASVIRPWGKIDKEYKLNLLSSHPSGYQFIKNYYPFKKNYLSFSGGFPCRPVEETETLDSFI